jgi:hypothetical protein
MSQLIETPMIIVPEELNNGSDHDVEINLSNYQLSVSNRKSSIASRPPGGY